MKALLYIKYSLTIVALLFVTACSDYLDLEPTDAISEEEVFDAHVNAYASLIGAYDQLGSPNFEGLYVPVMSDIMGEDMMINAVDNWNWFVEVYQLNILPNYTYTSNPWWSGYKLISDVNKLIANVHTIPDASAEEKNSIEGQARAIRAYTMLKLVQMYAPAYIKDKTAPSILLAIAPRDPNDEDISRASLEEVYAQIIVDLDAAINLLPDEAEEDLTTTNRGFFSKRAAKAVLARVYLNMNEWEMARDMAKEAYDGMDLMNLNDMYAGFFSQNSETIFSIAFTEDDNNVYLSLPSFYWPVSGYSSMRANDKFIDLFSTQDNRKNLMFRLDDIDANRNLIVKFAHNGSVGNAERICIRASEMYLIEAECEAELGNYSDAQNALYKIQKRANPAVSKSSAIGEELIEEVLLERRKELFGEGFRWNDIKRRQLPLVRTGDHWVDFDFSAEDEDYYRLTLPIPQSEIDANSKLTESDQNSGY